MCSMHFGSSPYLSNSTNERYDAMKIVVVGHMMEETILMPNMVNSDIVLGGPAAYASVASARLGTLTGVVTRVAQEFPQSFISALTQAGVDTTGIHYSPIGTTNILRYKTDGSKEITFLSQAPPITWADIPAVYRDADYFMICPVNFEVSLDLLKKLQKQRKTVLIDIGGYGGAASNNRLYDKEKRISLLQEIVACACFVKASEEDCRCIFEQTFTVQESMKQLKQLGINNVILTLGSKGALAEFENQQKYFPGYKTLAKEVTGAGDTWCGAFLNAISGGAELFSAVRYACATASLFITKTGGVSLTRIPSQEAIRKQMQEEAGADDSCFITSN